MVAGHGGNSGFVSAANAAGQACAWQRPKRFIPTNLWQLTQSKRSGRPSLKACEAQNLRNNRHHAVRFPIRDDHMPWVSAPDFGQSERMVVAPGHEERGLFNMPGGQSGHPLSAYFLAGHEAWVQGRAVALLPGRAEHRLSLHP
jgi:hypothetical protein